MDQNYLIGEKRSPETGIYKLPTKRSIKNLICINAVICGVEIVSSCAFTYIPPLLLKAGFSGTAMTAILGIAPFIDMVTVPTFARWSDKCSSKLGRRRPFIIILSVILLASLIMIPMSSKFLAVDNTNGILYMVFLASGVVLLDYSYQALFNPCESLLSDLMTFCDSSNRTLGFTIYSACISLGCILGYLVSSINWSTLLNLNVTKESLPFGITFLLFLVCLLMTISIAEEIPLTIFARYEANLNENNFATIKLKDDKLTAIKDQMSDGGYESDGAIELGDSLIEINFVRKFNHFRRHINFGIFQCSSIPKLVKNAQHLLWFTLYFPSKIFYVPLGWFQRICSSPTLIQRLFYAELWGWTSILCHSLFFTDFVGQYVNKGNPNAPNASVEAFLYDEGVQIGSWALFLQSCTACIYAFFLQQHLVLIFGPRIVFLGGVATFYVCMMLIVLLPSVRFVYIFTAFSGVGFAALTTTPNMLITAYHLDRKLYLWDGEVDESTGANQKTSGLGSYIAILDMAYYLSQIILSLFLGPIVTLTQSSLTYMVVSAAAGSLALYFSFKVVFNEEQLFRLRDGRF